MTKTGFVEFVILIGPTKSLTALSIDNMLPSLPNIGRDWKTAHANDVQLLVLIIIVGFGLEQIIYGPI